MNGRERDIGWGRVLGAAVLGLVLEWLVIALFVAATIEQSVNGVLAVAVFLGLPAVFAALLLPRSTRREGAGALVGLLIGSITGAGVCSGLLFLAGS